MFLLGFECQEGLKALIARTVILAVELLAGRTLQEVLRALEYSPHRDCGVIPVSLLQWSAFFSDTMLPIVFYTPPR